MNWFGNSRIFKEKSILPFDKGYLLACAHDNQHIASDILSHYRNCIKKPAKGLGLAIIKDNAKLTEVILKVIF